MTINQVASFIDHTNIKKNATEEDIIRTCQEAKDHNFRGVCINPEWVTLAKEELEGTNIKLVVLVDPPMGLSSHEERIKICEEVKQNGADDIDIVMNIVDLKYEKYEKVLQDLREICKIAPTKVIIGSGYLTDEEVRKASQIVKEAGAECVKTATEKDPLEHRELEEKIRHLKLMKEEASGLKVKASGNIKTFSDLKAVAEAGADIVGTSSGVQIIEEAIKNQNNDRI
jgi:deoxyribose-phosphate aldolase